MSSNQFNCGFIAPEETQEESSGVFLAAIGVIKVLVVLLPLFYFPGLIKIYRLPKETLLFFLSAVLCWLWLLGNRRSTFPLLVPIFSCFAIGGLSLINAINPFEGVIHLLNLFIGVSLFWGVANHLDRESIISTFRWIVITGTFVSLVGIVQAWGFDIPTVFQVVRPASTFGNKNHAAQYLLFVLPAAVYLFLSAPKSLREWLYAFMTALIATYLVYTNTRAAWGAAITAFIMLCFIRSRCGFSPRQILPSSRRKWCLLSGIIIFVTVMNILPSHFTTNFSSPNVLTRFQSMVQLKQDRFPIWANALSIFRDHPFLGVGKGNFQFVYPIYNRRIIKDNVFSDVTRVAEAHNDYAQLLVEVGLLGTIAFFWVLAVLARKCWMTIKRGHDPLLLAVGFALTAILVEAFWDFPFELATSTAFFWIYAGMLWSLATPVLQRRSSSGIIALLAIFSTAVFILSAMHLSAEFFHSRAVYSKPLAQGNQKKIDLAEKDLKYATWIYPFDFQYYFSLAHLLLKEKRYHEALQASLHGLSLDPYHINLLNNQGVIYAKLGDVNKATEMFKAALEIYPEYRIARKNLETHLKKTGQSSQINNITETP
jgi:O-antigen ligase